MLPEESSCHILFLLLLWRWKAVGGYLPIGADDVSVLPHSCGTQAGKSVSPAAPRRLLVP